MNLKYPPGKNYRQTESQKAGIDHCGGHEVFEPVCKYCQAVKDGTLENDNPRHWPSPPDDTIKEG